MIFKQVFDKKTSTYTYLIASAKGREAVIIDPVLENVNDYIQLLRDLDLKLVKVIDTHIHADHVTGASKLKQVTNCATLMGEHTPADAVEIKVKDNELINIDGLNIRSIYTPGHTAESYSFLFDNYLFSGDALLINGTGRTETLLYPGHDYNGEKVSTIGKEKKFNPRLQVKNVDEYIEIMSNLNLSKPEMMDNNVSKNIQLGAN
jgi:glyoxylase-like metal-dependent hydrolase (beta-lactamase superfamily II)